jgi:pimeloyl-ACP methyl ester carboxylesterase
MTRFGAVHYWSAGSGLPLLLLHQSAQSSDKYLGLLACLTDGFRVVSLDLHGHGVSETPDHELGVDEYCEAVMSVLDTLDVEETHVLAHHGG